MTVTALNPTPDPQPHVTIETITPEIASVWLDHNTHNRSMRKNHVAALAHAISAGQWVMNGDSIKVTGGSFENPGVVVDGQHRLGAVVESDAAISTVIAWNVPLETQVTVDVGARRSLGDVLHWRGEQRPRDLAAALNALYRFERGDGFAGTANDSRASFQDLLDLLDQHPHIRECVATIDSLRRNVPIPRGAMSATMYQLWRLSPADANVFFDLLRTGAGLPEGSPVLHLRRALEKNGRSDRKMNVRHQLALTIKAWNIWIRGDTIKLLSWRPGAASPEPFPVPIGPDQA